MQREKRGGLLPTATTGGSNTEKSAFDGQVTLELVQEAQVELERRKASFWQQQGLVETLVRIHKAQQNKNTEDKI